MEPHSPAPSTLLGSLRRVLSSNRLSTRSTTTSWTGSIRRAFSVKTRASLNGLLLKAGSLTQDKSQATGETGILNSEIDSREYNLQLTLLRF